MSRSKGLHMRWVFPSLIALVLSASLLPANPASAHSASIYVPYRWATEYEDCSFYIFGNGVFCEDKTRDVEYWTSGSDWTSTKQARLQDAHARWNNVTTLEYFNFAFKGHRSASTSCVNNDYNENVQFWLHVDGEPASGEDILAATTKCILPDDLSMYNFIIEYDTGNTWHFGTSNSVPSATAIDFTATAIHEFGHGAGWSSHFPDHPDSPRPECPDPHFQDDANPDRHTMCRWYGVEKTTLNSFMRSLEFHDKETFQEAYGGVPV